MLAVIILAAGNSKRMNSKLSKVLHPLGGLPMIHHVLQSTSQLEAHQTILVTSPHLKDHPSFNSYTVIVQDEPKGTGHAVKTALTALDPTIEEVMILCGDTPLIYPETLNQLKNSHGDLALIGIKLSTINHAYGLIVQDKKGKPSQIIEFKDANEEQRKIPFGNAGVYKIKAFLLHQFLSELNNTNAAGEYYLTDLVSLVYNQGFQTALLEGKEQEFQGINTRAELAKAEEVLQNRWRLDLMNSGVTLMQPETIFLSYDTKIGKDSRVGPFVNFGPNVNLGEDVTIFPFCHLENVKIEEKASVGPFAHLRGHTLLKTGSSIGNFVEVKGSTIGEKAKAKHLSYLGDAEIGEKVNIGAGTITCNYDGFVKSKTIIEDEAMIGANTSLVAPVTVGKRAIVAAGSTITETVPSDSLVIARSKPSTKINWAKQFREKKKK